MCVDRVGVPTSADCLRLFRSYFFYFTHSFQKPTGNDEYSDVKYSGQNCLLCDGTDQVYNMQMPRVFRFLAAELSSVGIRLFCEVQNPKNRDTMVGGPN